MTDGKSERPQARRIAHLVRRAEAASTQSAETQTAIINAAAAAFMEEGFAQTSIDAVALRLSATKGLIYHYYRTKTELFFDVCRHALAIAFAAVEPHFRSRDRAVTRLKRMCEAHVLTVVEKIAFQHVILQGVTMPAAGPKLPEDRAVVETLIAERARYEQLFRSALDAAVAEGDLPKGIIGALAAKALFSVIDAPVVWYRPSEAETLAERHAMVRGLSLFALRGAGVSQAILDEEF